MEKANPSLLLVSTSITAYATKLRLAYAGKEAASNQALMPVGRAAGSDRGVQEVGAVEGWVLAHLLAPIITHNYESIYLILKKFILFLGIFIHHLLLSFSNPNASFNFLNSYNTIY